LKALWTLFHLLFKKPETNSDGLNFTLSGQTMSIRVWVHLNKSGGEAT